MYPCYQMFMHYYITKVKYFQHSTATLITSSRLFSNVSHQGLKEVIGNGHIFFCCILGFARKEDRVVHKFSYHGFAP